jgi:hypothetical protein
MLDRLRERETERRLYYSSIRDGIIYLLSP